jgi:inosine-uridine nucleoside N-ribohydrolase
VLRLIAVALLLLAPAVGRELVVIDTDSGLFGDDGAALAMLVRSPRQVAIAGITLVPGNAWPKQGAEYTFHILRLLGRPLEPLYAGTEGPLLHSAAQAREAERRWGPIEYTGAFAANPDEVKRAPGASPTGRRPAPRGAVQFLIDTVERNPGQTTILALGPMTNVALALALRPSIGPRIRQIVFMGGNLKAPGNASRAAEFNFWFDAEAARIVLRSTIPKKVMFALDACNKAPVRKAEFDQIAAVKTPLTALFAEDLGNRYPAFHKNPDAVTYLWDSLAAAWLIDPGFVTASQEQYLDVQSAYGRFYGATIPLDRRFAPSATPVLVVQDINYPRVWALFKDLITRR